MAGGTWRGAPAALLGADVARSGDGRWLVERVLPGESSDPYARSPFAAPGVAVREGDEILAVDGHPVDPVYGPWPALAGTYGKPVELTIRPADPSLVPRPPVDAPEGDTPDAGQSAKVGDESGAGGEGSAADAQAADSADAAVSPGPLPRREPTVPARRMSMPRTPLAPSPCPTYPKYRLQPSPFLRHLPSLLTPKPAGSSSCRSMATADSATRTG